MPVINGTASSSSEIETSSTSISANSPRMDFVAAGKGLGVGVTVGMLAAPATNPSVDSRSSGVAIPNALNVPRPRMLRRVNPGIEGSLESLNGRRRMIVARLAAKKLRPIMPHFVPGHNSWGLRRATFVPRWHWLIGSLWYNARGFQRTLLAIDSNHRSGQKGLYCVEYTPFALIACRHS